MTEVRWGEGSTPETAGEARERLLDAAVVCFERVGVKRTSIADVASEAKVTRPTVYRYFKNRDDIYLAFLLRLGPSFMQAAYAHLGARELSSEEAVVEIVLYMITTLPKSPWAGVFFEEDTLAITQRLMLETPDIVDMGAAMLGAYLEPAQSAGRVREDLDLSAYLEWLMRFVFSKVAVPGPDVENQDALRRQIRQMLLPPLFTDS